MKMNKILMSITAAAALVSTSGVSVAATDTASLAVTANVAVVCSIASVSGVDFGNLVSNGTDAVNSGNIDWSCSTGNSATLTLGTGGSGSIGAREMTGAGGDLAYQLYTDSAATTTVFGDGLTTGSVTGTGTGVGSLISTPVYGRILSADIAGAATGSYSDTVQVTLTF